MDVSIVEARQQELAACVDDACLPAAPGADFFFGTHGNDAIPKHSERLRAGSCRVDRPDVRVSDNEVGRRIVLSETRAASDQ